MRPAGPDEVRLDVAVPDAHPVVEGGGRQDHLVDVAGASPGRVGGPIGRRARLAHLDHLRPGFLLGDDLEARRELRQADDMVRMLVGDDDAVEGFAELLGGGDEVAGVLRPAPRVDGQHRPRADHAAEVRHRQVALALRLALQERIDVRGQLLELAVDHGGRAAVAERAALGLSGVRQHEGGPRAEQRAPRQIRPLGLLVDHVRSPLILAAPTCSRAGRRPSSLPTCCRSSPARSSRRGSSGRPGHRAAERCRRATPRP